MSIRRARTLVSLFLATACTVAATGCVITTKDKGAADGLPADPGGVAPEPKINNVKPAAQFHRAEDGSSVVRVNTLGLIDPVTAAPIPFRANETIFVTEDGVLKGIRVTQSSSENKLPVDLVFVVDNSGSMGEEANSVADKIIAFSSLLQSSGLDVRLGVVGYDGLATGGINLDNAAAIEAFLKRPLKTGTARTHGFDGADAAKLEAAAKTQKSPSAENGIVGVTFAEANYTWRERAQRVFVNFTDEPTQPGNQDPWTTKTLCSGWTPLRGTIHTIWSGSTPLSKMSWADGSRENPADLSTCTPGGVVREVKSDASDLDLTTLPMTDALRNSALVEFESRDVAAPHEIVLTVKNGETADGKTVYAGVRY